MRLHEGQLEVWLGAEVVEEDGLEVTFGSTGEDGDDDFACIFWFGGFLKCGPGGCTAANANGEALELHEVDSGSDGVDVGDGNDAVNEVDAKGVRNETGTEAFDAMGTGAATGEDSAGGGFDGDDFDGGFAGAQAFGDAGEGATRADPDDDDINGTIGVLPDFCGGTFTMGTRVGRVVELLGIPGIWKGGAQFDDFVDGTPHAEAPGSEEDLGAEATQEEATFAVSSVRHSEDALVATGGRDPSEGNAHIAAGGFSDDAAGAQKTLGFGFADHLQGDPVFDTATGTEHFKFGEERCATLRSNAL